MPSDLHPLLFIRTVCRCHCTDRLRVRWDRSLLGALPAVTARANPCGFPLCFSGIVMFDPVIPADRTLIPSPPPRPKNPVFDDEEKSKV